MFVAGHTMGTPEMIPEEAFAFFARIGCAGTELVCQEGYGCGVTPALFARERRRLREAARDHGAPIVALTRGDIDAYLAGDTDLGQIEVQGFPVRQIPFKVPPALEGTGAFYLGAREDFLRANPRVAIGAGRALAKGTVFALHNLEAAARLFFKTYPEALPKGKTADVATEEIAKLMGARAKNWVRPNQPPRSWGRILVKDWEADVKFLGLEGKVPGVERFFTNEFIERINDFDEAKIAEQARTYKLR